MDLSRSVADKMDELDRNSNQLQCAPKNNSMMLNTEDLRTALHIEHTLRGLM